MAKTRLGKLINSIEDYNNNFVYYDEDKDETVIDGTEEEVYAVIMQDEELHLLGTETVKNWIHLWYTNWNKYEEMKWAMRKAQMI